MRERTEMLGRREEGDIEGMEHRLNSKNGDVGSKNINSHCVVLDKNPPCVL